MTRRAIRIVEAIITALSEVNGVFPDAVVTIEDLTGLYGVEERRLRRQLGSGAVSL